SIPIQRSVLGRTLLCARRLPRLAEDDELDATVLGPAGLAVLLANWLGLAVAVRLEALRLHAVLDEVGLDRRRAVLGEAHVVVVVAALVRVPLHLEEQDLRVALQRRRYRVQDGERDRLDDRLGGLEVDLVEDLERALAQDDAALVGAAILVLVAVVGLRLV